MVPPDETFCSSRALPVWIGPVKGALIRPDDHVAIHGRHVMEIALEHLGLPKVPRLKILKVAQNDSFQWEKMGIQGDVCVYVGDTSIDMVAGKAAGMKTIGVLTGFDNHEDLLRKNPDCIIDSISDLPRVLKLYG